jgi:hypothetical protein
MYPRKEESKVQTDPSTTPVYLTARQIAAALHCHPVTVATWVRRGCPRHRVNLNRFGFDLSEVKAWLETMPAPSRPIRAGRGVQS